MGKYFKYLNLFIIISLVLNLTTNIAYAETKSNSIAPISDYERIMELINGDKPLNIVFAGDSITHGPLHTKGFRSYSEHFNERFRGELVNGKEKNDSFIINVGISSGTSNDILNNFQNFITDHKPDIVFVTIGMNDATSITVEKYKDNIELIVDKIREIGAIPILQTSNTVKGSRGRLNLMMDTLRTLSNEKSMFLIDHQKYWLAQEVINPNLKNQWLNDSIHPNAKGHLEMAKLIFRELKLDDSTSYTNNLTYPIVVNGFNGKTIEKLSYTKEKILPKNSPVVSYKVNREFFGKSYLNYNNDIDTIKDLSKGAIVARVNLTTAANAQTIFSMSDSKDPSSNITLSINAGKIHFSSRENNSFGNNINIASPTLNDGNWHTLIINVDDSGTKVYVDGDIMGQYTSKGFFSLIQTPDELNIGRNVHDNGLGEWYYNGAISYVDIYDEPISEAEALNITKKIFAENIGNTQAVKDLVSANEPGSWVFLGDETTAGKVDTYGYKNYVEYIEERLRWEYGSATMIKRQKFVINSGVEGTTSTDILQNINKWALDYKPKAAFVMIGGNETVSVEKFKENIIEIVKRIKEAGVVPVLQTPIINKNDISEYVRVLREVAKSEGIALVDHYDYWNMLNQDQELEKSWLTNNYNPNHVGHYEIAKKFLIHFSMFSQTGTVGSFRIPMPGDKTLDENKALLSGYLEEGAKILNNAVEGTEEGNYLSGSKYNLEKSIDAVNLELNGTNLTMDLVLSLIRNIENSINEFNSRRIFANEDVTRDGVVDILDLSKVATYYNEVVTEERLVNLDLNKDGIIDIFDMVKVSKRIA